MVSKELIGSKRGGGGRGGVRLLDCVGHCGSLMFRSRLVWLCGCVDWVVV